LYRRILVGLDGSELAERALPHAAALADIFDATLMLLAATAADVDLTVAPAAHAAAAGVPPADALDRGRIEEALRREAAAYLQRIAGEQRRRGLAVECAAVDGPAAAALLGRAREAPVDLIVLTTRGRGGLGRLLLGSVADAVVRHAPCPVLLVRAGVRPLESQALYDRGRILVALDGSARAERVLPHVRSLAVGLGSKVTLLQVHVASPAPLGVVTAVGRVAQQAYLAEQAQRLRHVGIDAEARLADGDPADEIVRQAERPRTSLVALTTRGRGGLDRLVLGSVADAVIRRAPCAVLVVRSATEADESAGRSR
jgi:nucleotide-binding universal stress UspA family protein